VDTFYIAGQSELNGHIHLKVNILLYKW